MKLVKINVGKDPKKKEKKVGVCEHDTSNMGTSDSTSNISTVLGHVSETASDWLTRNDHANAPEVSVSQKPTRGEM
jgi:hypothetical protein